MSKGTLRTQANHASRFDLFGRMSTIVNQMSAEDHPSNNANVKRSLQERVMAIKSALQRKEISPDQARELLESIRKELGNTGNES